MTESDWVAVGDWVVTQLGFWRLRGIVRWPRHRAFRVDGRRPVAQRNSEKGVTAVDKRQSNLDFRLMSLSYRLRDWFRPRMDILREAGIKPGVRVLDYGCGPGSYVVDTAGLAGEAGRVYALDVHPLAIQMVEDLASRNRLTNVETIRSDRETGLPDSSVDVVLLYDVLHDLSEPDGVLQELHRVLKPGGLLSFSDHHMKEEEIVSRVTRGGLFELWRKGERTFTFVRQ